MNDFGANKSFDTAVSEPSDVIEAPVRHSDYFFEDGNLVIQVENTLFNVFRSTFTQHSPVFKDVLSLPKPGVFFGQVEGSSDACPMQFPGISSVDFERLLWIIYPPTFGANKPETAEQWTSILHLATRWEFDDIRALAIREIECYPLSPANIISLSREFDICSPWALKAYTELCERQESLTMQEASALGLQTSVRISQLREQLRKPGRPNSLPVPISRGSIKRPASENDSQRLRMHNRKESAIDPAARRKALQSRGAAEKSWRFSHSSRLVAEAFGLEGISVV